MSWHFSPPTSRNPTRSDSLHNRSTFQAYALFLLLHPYQFLFLTLKHRKVAFCCIFSSCNVCPTYCNFIFCLLSLFLSPLLSTLLLYLKVPHYLTIAISGLKEEQEHSTLDLMTLLSLDLTSPVPCDYVRDVTSVLTAILVYQSRLLNTKFRLIN